jgi:hypothetical protein
MVRSPLSDRDYFFLARAMHADGLDRMEFVRRMATTALPTWRSLEKDGRISSACCFARIGDVDLQTDGSPVRGWDYFVLIEVAEGVDARNVARVEQEGLRHGGLLDDERVEILSEEILQRRAGSGTAVPRPSPRLPAMPTGFTVAIEYISIPEERWLDYQRFMRDVFGPVGCLLVERGDAYKVIITERVALLHWDDSLPHWNRIHILMSDFDDEEAGFLPATNQAVRDVLNTESDVYGALEAVEGYRRKPCMSKNIVLPDLSIGCP